MFEVQGLDHWMDMGQSSGSESAAVKYKECPKCKSYIMRCPRYMNQINHTLNDINAIKKKILEKEEEYQSSLSLVGNDIEEIKSKISSFDTSQGYFKNCKTLVTKL